MQDRPDAGKALCTTAVLYIRVYLNGFKKKKKKG